MLWFMCNISLVPGSLVSKLFSPANYMLYYFWSSTRSSINCVRYWRRWWGWNFINLKVTFCFFGVGYKLRENCSNTDVFLVRIFRHSNWVPVWISGLSISPYSVRMRENTDQKRLRIWTLFTHWYPSSSYQFF